MKKIALLLLFIPFFGFSQELKLNDVNSLYEYSHIKESTNTTINDIEKNISALKYTNIYKSENTISGENYFSVLIMGTPLQVHYYASIEFKENKYKLTINKFIIEDKRWSPIPLENIKTGRSRWIKKINENLPKIVKSIETISTW
jgi:hypothetical protein